MARRPVQVVLGPAQPIPPPPPVDVEKKKKKRNPITPPISPTPATDLSLEGVKVGLMDAILSGARTPTERKEKRRDAKAKKRAAEETMKKAASRLVHVTLSTSWNTWLSYNNETLHIRESLERASSILMNPLLMKSLSKWREWYRERRGSLQAMNKIMHHMSMAAEIDAFNTWAKLARSTSLTRAAVTYHEKFNRIKLVRAFNAWSMQQLYCGMHRNLEANNLCSAFGFWMRAKVSGCAPAR